MTRGNCNGERPAQRRRFVLRYTILTTALCLPLLWAFATLKNTYPVAASTMMMDGRVLEAGRNYYILRGETVGGRVINVAPATLINALYGRTWEMVAATVNNNNFRLRSLHPLNAAVLGPAADADKLPRGARVPELLRIWGELYNEKLPAGEQGRLKSIRLDEYRWEGRRYADYDNLKESWHSEL